MAADGSTFVAGHYTATFDGVAIGTTEVGFNIRPVHYKEDIKIDDLGDAIVDGIYRGYNCRVTFQLSEWIAAAVAKLQNPYGGTEGTIASVGQTLVTLAAKSLVLTPVTGINSALKTYTFSLCVPDGEHGGFNMNTKLRRLDCNLLALANRTSGIVYSHN